MVLGGYPWNNALFMFWTCPIYSVGSLGLGKRDQGSLQGVAIPTQFADILFFLGDTPSRVSSPGILLGELQSSGCLVSVLTNSAGGHQGYTRWHMGDRAVPFWGLNSRPYPRSSSYHLNYILRSHLYYFSIFRRWHSPCLSPPFLSSSPPLPTPF